MDFLEFICEFIGDFIAGVWTQLTQPEEKGLPPRKRRVLFNVGMIVVSLLMCLLQVYFLKMGNIKGVFSIAFLFIFGIASFLFAVSRRKRK